MLERFLAAVETVHTSGINWQAIAVIELPLMAIMAGFWRLMSRDVKSSVKEIVSEELAPMRQDMAVMRSDIDALRKADTGLDSRLARIEGNREGRRDAMYELSGIAQRPIATEEGEK